MKLSEAKSLVMSEWRTWKHDNVPKDSKPSPIDAMVFFQFLQRERPDLLHFRYGGDKYQIIHSWLRGAREVSD